MSDPAMMKSLRDQLDLWESNHTVEASDSAWSSPLVAATRCNDKGPVKKIRWCLDLRYINSNTKRDASPIPNLAASLEQMHGARFYSTIDLLAAYHGVPVHPDSRDLLAFNTPFGQYRLCKIHICCCLNCSLLTDMMLGFVGCHSVYIPRQVSSRGS